MALTALLILILAFFGWTGIDERMDLFAAVGQAFSAMPTGGFGTDPRSIEPFAAAPSGPRALHGHRRGELRAPLPRVRAEKPAALARDEEFRLYVALMLVASAVLAAVLWESGIHEGEAAVRHSVFQTVSIMTTTGFASTDYNEWLAVAPFAAMLVVALMFPGGSAGSTAGSIKVVRHLVIGKVLRRELDQTVHPEFVGPIRVNRMRVDGWSAP